MTMGFEEITTHLKQRFPMLMVDRVLEIELGKEHQSPKSIRSAGSRRSAPAMASPPGAAALQFSIRDPRVTSTICGVTRPERVQQTLDWANFPIPRVRLGQTHGPASRDR